MKFIPVTAMIFVFIFILSWKGYSAVFNQTFSPTFDIFNTNNSTPADRINRYNVIQLISTEFNNILDMANNRIFFEVHLGIGGNYLLDNSISDINNHLYFAAIQYGSGYHALSFSGSVLIKINLFNPKLPFADNILSKIEYINELSGQYNFSLSENSRNKIIHIRQEILDYTSQFWFKRFSIGMGIPFDTAASGIVNYRVVNLGAIAFHVEDIFFFLGYDLGDFITFEIGPNISFNRIFFGFSLDLSTPVYKLTGFSLNVIRQLFGMPAI